MPEVISRSTPTPPSPQGSGKRYMVGKLKGFIGARMEARSFWAGLGFRNGIKIVAQVLPEAKTETVGNGKGKNPISTPALFIVKAQCGVFDVRDFKKGDEYDRDQRPGRALNALMKYCESDGIPASCKRFHNAKALKALAKRPLTLKDLGGVGAADGTNPSVSKKRQTSTTSTSKQPNKQAKTEKKKRAVSKG